VEIDGIQPVSSLNVYTYATYNFYGRVPFFALKIFKLTLTYVLQFWLRIWVANSASNGEKIKKLGENVIFKIKILDLDLREKLKTFKNLIYPAEVRCIPNIMESLNLYKTYSQLLL